MNVALIGMPGCGKSTFGKRLAKELGYAFADADPYVEQIAGKTIPALFEQGEDVFRAWETEACRQLSKRERTVIACGGGVVTREETMQALQKGCIILFIDRPIGQIAGDVDTESRPLLKQGVERLYALHKQRAHLYRKYAQYTVLNDGSFEETLQKLKERCKEAGI